MDEACTIRADGAGSTFRLVHFYRQIELSKGIGTILEGPVVNVDGSILGKAAAHMVVSSPLIDHCVEFSRSSLSFLL